MTTVFNVNHSDGTLAAVVSEGQVNRGSTSISLFGHAVTSFGEELNENMLHIMEHFAATVAPLNPVEGQMWFDRDNVILRVFKDNEWNPVGISFSTTAPPNRTLGMMWLDPADGLIKAWNGSIWAMIGSINVQTISFDPNTHSITVSGGGGSANISKLYAQTSLRTFGSIELVPVDFTNPAFIECNVPFDPATYPDLMHAFPNLPSSGSQRVVPAPVAPAGTKYVTCAVLPDVAR